MTENLDSTRNFLPKFLKLTEQDYVKIITEPAKALPKTLKGKSLLTTILIEEKDQFSNPKRIIELLDSITLLYDSCATVKKQSSSDLAILACDSGSDKAFDFLGAAKIIEMVKEIILSFWDRVLFFIEK